MAVTKARIDLAAFRHNLQSVRKLVGPSVAILPVIKADAYGHGVLPLAREAMAFGAPMLGLGTLDEGIAVRRAKIAAPLLLLDGVFKDQVADAVRYNLTPVVYSLDICRELNRAGRAAGKKLPVHLKFDTGMSRLGFGFDEAEEVIERVGRMKHLAVEGVMTHLASSGDKDSPQTELQLKRFEDVLDMVEEAALKPTWIHAANSGAIINFRESHYNMARPGIVLYGAPPAKAKVSFKPVMTVTSRLMSVKTVPAGEGVSYDATYITPRSKRIGVVAGGYADGVNRLLSNQGEVVVRGKRVPIVGIVCMDSFMVDLSKVPAARAGDDVTLLGGTDRELSARSWAQRCGTIPYEIFCRIGNRVERVCV